MGEKSFSHRREKEKKKKSFHICQIRKKKAKRKEREWKIKKKKDGPHYGRAMEEKRKTSALSDMRKRRKKFNYNLLIEETGKRKS